MLSYTVVSPGRVNIIGEHVDHQNYPVFPCAIAQSIEVKVEQTLTSDPSYNATPALQIFHVAEDCESVIFQEVGDIKIESDKFHWYNYLIASYFGICEYLHHGCSLKAGHTIDRYKGLPKEYYDGSTGGEEEKKKSPCYKKFKLVVGGEGVPQAAGLSSSSALTCAGAIAWMIEPRKEGEELPFELDTGSSKWKLLLSRNEIASVSAHGEGYSGTASGGMDQAAICLSQKGKALEINFNPLKTRAVSLPKELTIVVANTCRAAPKAISYAKMYNKRVFELKCACYIILKQHGMKLTIQELLTNGLRETLKLIGTDEKTFLNKEMLTILHEGPYTREEITKCVDSETRDYLLDRRCGREVWLQNDDFYLLERVRHVLTENARVQECVELCSKYGDQETTPESVLCRIGECLDGSFKSLTGDFDCGCPELTELVTICKKAGAYGSRLTGAGWGGCTVSLVHKDKVDAFLKQVAAEYFEPIQKGTKKYSPPLETDFSDLKKVLFATSPSSPASVI